MSEENKVDRHWRGKYGELLEQLRNSLAAGFVAELKMTPDQAVKAADMAIELMRSEISGNTVYFAKGHLYAITEKHRRIYRRFTGANHAQLAREFNLTERQIYSIVAAVGDEEFKRRQGTLPGV